ncbi:hypothetical protein [Methylobacterium frigidaeris]|uniref:hypothetical protein n=1 Tax=Methylobacterium frigidaeris TaxID=2038277 RepID=UPI0013FE236B|nr:hypothetical protein [Methylobacterium frigidaeris]
MPLTSLIGRFPPLEMSRALDRRLGSLVEAETQPLIPKVWLSSRAEAVIAAPTYENGRHTDVQRTRDAASQRKRGRLAATPSRLFGLFG